MSAARHPSGPDQRLRAARVLLDGELVGPAEVVIEGGTVREVRPTDGHVEDVVVAPGFVDLQVNGMGAVDVSTAAGTDWDDLDASAAATGVTAWLPTVVSRPLDRYAGPLGRIDEARRREGHRPAVLGVHLEGPFLGGRPGAHDRESLVDPDPDWLQALPDTVRMVTIAPERAGAIDAVRLLTARGTVVSLGHSTADVETTVAGFDAGATMVTHLFNAMAPLHQREPGIAGAALADDRVTAGLVADLVHVHPAWITTAFRTKGPRRVALVTDAVAWRARRLAELDIGLVDGAPRLPDGTIAGSALTMDSAVRNVVDRAGVSLADALLAAATTPADVLRDTSRGRLVPGARADLVVLGGDDLAVRRTLVGGVTIWER